MTATRRLQLPGRIARPGASAPTARSSACSRASRRSASTAISPRRASDRSARELLTRGGAGAGAGVVASPLAAVLAFVDLGDAKDAACGPVLAGAQRRAQRTTKGEPRDDVGTGTTAKAEDGKQGHEEQERRSSSGSSERAQRERRSQPSSTSSSRADRPAAMTSPVAVRVSGLPVPVAHRPAGAFDHRHQRGEIVAASAPPRTPGRDGRGEQRVIVAVAAPERIAASRLRASAMKRVALVRGEIAAARWSRDARSASSRHGAGAGRLAVERGRLARARRSSVRRAIGWSITPSTGQPLDSSAISVPKIGRPAMKLRVPSIGSSTHGRPAPSRSPPYSSPMMPSARPLGARGSRASPPRRRGRPG